MAIKKNWNKRGWIIIVESFIAVLIVASAFLLIYSKDRTNTDISDKVYEHQRDILEVIASNESLRNEIITRNNRTVHQFIEKNINNNWNYIINICSLDQICNQGIPTKQDIYVSETIISATLTNYPGEQSTKVRLFFWKK